MYETIYAFVMKNPLFFLLAGIAVLLPMPGSLQTNHTLPSRSPQHPDVRELKPDNQRAIKRGEKQVQGYMKELEELRPDKKWEWHVDTYKRD